MDTGLGPEHTEHLPKHRVVQNGHPRDNKDLPTDFKDAYFHILIHKSVQEVQAFSYPGLVLPVQSPTLMSVHSTQGVHTGGQRGLTDGFTEGYKNPPVPQRLVGESHIPPNLSPAYTDFGSSLSRTRLAGEQCKVITGSKTGFQLRRLPVRPQGGQGQTHTRSLADLTREDTVNSVRSGVPGPAVHVPHRGPNNHRKASPLRATSYVTHTVALEKQLEGTGITRKGDTHPQITTPHLRWWLEESNVLTGQPLHPLKHALQIFTDASKERWGAHLNECTARRIWSLPESKLHINHLELKAVFLALKESLCALPWRILSWCTRKQVTLKAHHISGRLNVIADKLSRLGQTIQTEWSLHPEVFQAICSRWHHPQVDLFATRFNNKLPQFVSLVPDPEAWAVDALSLSWENVDPYAFPLAAILGKVVEKLQDYSCNMIILIALGWPNMPWFWAGLGSSTWNQVQVQVLCHIASTSTSTGVKNQVQVL